MFFGSLFIVEIYVKDDFLRKNEILLCKNVNFVYKGKYPKIQRKSAINLFCRLLLIEQIYQFNSLTGDLHFSIPLNIHPTCQYLWPYSKLAESHYGQNGHDGHYGLTIYGHGYGQNGSLFQDICKSCQSVQIICQNDMYMSKLYQSVQIIVQCQHLSKHANENETN